MEVALDEDCSQIIVRRQPAAGDLRMIFAIMQDRDRPRAHRRRGAEDRAHGEEHPRARRAAGAAGGRSAARGRGRDLRCCAARSTPSRASTADGAAEVIREDAGIDTEFRSILRQLITYMMEDPRTISTSLEIVWVAKAIERIGDHAKNMAEYVIYIVKGTRRAPHPARRVEREALADDRHHPRRRGRAADPGADRGQPRAQRPQGAARGERRGGRGVDPRRAARRAAARLDAARANRASRFARRLRSDGAHARRADHHAHRARRWSRTRSRAWRPAPTTT